MRLKTIAATAKPLSEHFEYHLRLTTLLSIICWRNISFEKMLVQREIDDGDATDKPSWASMPKPLISTRFDPWEPPKANKPYLLSFDDIGESGLATWFSLMADYSSPLRQISYIAKMRKSLTLENQVVLFGIAFEELGVTILKSQNRQLSICECIEGLLGDSFSDRKESAFLFDGALPKVIANTYSSVKHPKKMRGGRPREEWLRPDHLRNVVLACRAFSLIWIANKLGCREKVVRELELETQFSQALMECSAYA